MIQAWFLKVRSLYSIWNALLRVIGMDDAILTIVQFAKPETNEERHFLGNGHLWEVVWRTTKLLVGPLHSNSCTKRSGQTWTWLLEA